MQTLLYPDVFQAVASGKFEDPNHKRSIDLILNNQNAEIIYSKKMLDMIRVAIADEDASNYQALVTKLSDEGKNLKSSDNSTCIDDEIEHLNNIASGCTVLNIAYKEPLKKDLGYNVAIIIKQAKPNYHWLVCSLASVSPNKVTVSCHDFKQDKDIEIFFNQVFSLSKHLSVINIFDTQCNMSHNKFNYIIGKNAINYYTKKGSYKGSSDEDNYDKIKSKFISNFKMFTVASRRAHARRIVINEIVITCDNDYWNLAVDGQDWSIDVQISKDDALNWLKRTTLYSQFISKVRR